MLITAQCETLSRHLCLHGVLELPEGSFGEDVEGFSGYSIYIFI